MMTRLLQAFVYAAPAFALLPSDVASHAADPGANATPPVTTVWRERAWTSNRSGTLSLRQYRLTFDENFDTFDCAPGSFTSPSGQHRWYSYGGFGKAKFASCRGADTPYTINNGILTITASYKDGQWRSGSIASMSPKGEGFRQKFGVFAARIRLPADVPSGLRIWPAFWMLSRYVEPGDAYAYNEFDVLENFGKNARSFSSTLFQWPAKSGPEKSSLVLKSKMDFGEYIQDGQWHEYAVKWTPSSWVVYFDRRELGRIAVPPGAPAQPMYPIVDLALNDISLLASKSATYSMYVDWVKVYACVDESCSADPGT